jgi:2-polyprenyl-6-methoxyphenol hydroxylase-like FAD-dependent oxidoreductase
MYTYIVPTFIGDGDHPMHPRSTTDVLIAGAGPTGLTLACELARRAVPFRLVDIAPNPFNGSRGKGLQPRTLEVFDDLGIVHDVLASGAPYPRFRVHVGPFSTGFWAGCRIPSPSVDRDGDAIGRRLGLHARLARLVAKSASGYRRVFGREQLGP